MKTGKIALVQKVIPPYRVPVFSRLTALHDVVVFHSRKRKKSNFTVVENPPFPNRYLKSCYYSDSDTTLIQNLWPALRLRPRIVICEFALGFASFWILFMLRRVMGYKFVAWTHGVTGQELNHPFSNRKSKFKRWVYNRVDALITYSPLRQRILQNHVKNPEKVFLAQNTLDLGPILKLQDEFEKTGRGAIKQELGFTKKFNLMFMGRLRPEKDIPLLLDVFEEIQSHLDVELHIVGNGSEESKVNEAIHRGLPIRYHGPVYGDKDSGKMLFASDLMVMPGMVGLSIVHGFAFGLPIVTVAHHKGGPNHSPEIEFLKDDVNGIFAQRDDLAERIISLLQDEAKIKQMRIEALRTAKEDCSIDKMIQGFSDCIAFLS